MRFRVTSTSALLLLALCFSGAAAYAQGDPNTTREITYTINGTLGPVLKGNDVLHLNGKTLLATAIASASQNPIKRTATSATYVLPTGNVTVTTGSDTDSTIKPARLEVYVGSSGCALKISGPLVKIYFSGYSALPKGSFGQTALQHPTPLNGGPYTLSSPSSFITYRVQGKGTATLGLSGTIMSN